MVFVIQNTQNRGARAVNLKLDELLRAVKGARTDLVQLEEPTEKQLAALTNVQARAAARLDKQAPALEKVSRQTPRPDIRLRGVEGPHFAGTHGPSARRTRPTKPSRRMR
jgi:low affinity Fe/Cu permease